MIGLTGAKLCGLASNAFLALKTKLRQDDESPSEMAMDDHRHLREILFITLMNRRGHWREAAADISREDLRSFADSVPLKFEHHEDPIEALYDIVLCYERSVGYEGGAKELGA